MKIISCDSPAPYFNGWMCAGVCPDGPREASETALRGQTAQEARIWLQTLQTGKRGTIFAFN